MSARDHWDSIWRNQPVERAGWYQTVPIRSLDLIAQLDLAPDEAVVDVGGGASSLVPRLVERGHRDVTVVDISPAAIAQARSRATHPEAITWLVADVLDGLARCYSLWHDRAVFHFLGAEERPRYVDALTRATVAGSRVIVATFGPEAPSVCSGLPVTRYDPAALSDALGTPFEPVRFDVEHHSTPAGVVQQFVYGVFRRK